MSPTRHAAAPESTPCRGDAITVGPFPLTRGEGFSRHVHEEHQLAWTARGALTVATAERVWVLPRSRALWIPAGVHHSVDVAVAVRMYSVYFPVARPVIRWPEPTVVAVSPLLGELIMHLADPDQQGPARRRAEALVLDLLDPVAVAPLRTPQPEDDRARAVADALLVAPDDARSLAAWGRTVGASERTLSRRFTAETGMSFTEWRTRARMVAALPLLADGGAIATVGRAVGYANPSAFIAAFRRTFGVTPRAYFDASPELSEIR